MQRNKQGRLRRPEWAEVSGLFLGHSPSIPVGIPGSDHLAGVPSTQAMRLEVEGLATSPPLAGLAVTLFRLVLLI